MSEQPIRIVIPTGRMYDDVRQLLEDAGLRIPKASKNYRPVADDPRFRIKLLKAANIPTLLELGAHDIGFSGTDWVRETGAGVDTLLDTGLLPVRIVSAAPAGMNPFGKSPGRPIVVASEYERITTDYMASRKVDWRFVRTYGATEVFPPEDADLIVDNTATGSALAANRLEIVRRAAVLDDAVSGQPARRCGSPGFAQAVEDLTPVDDGRARGPSPGPAGDERRPRALDAGRRHAAGDEVADGPAAQRRLRRLGQGRRPEGGCPAVDPEAETGRRHRHPGNHASGG